jgi:hypothetical protein
MLLEYNITYNIVLIEALLVKVLEKKESRAGSGIREVQVIEFSAWKGCSGRLR